MMSKEGILLLDKPKGVTSFSLIPKLRFLFKEKKIGHGGTLDPLATGLMVYLIGKKYTKTADSYLMHQKRYLATLLLGQERDSYDVDGEIIATSDYRPTLEEVQEAIKKFNGDVEQIPPMFSAKKVQGKKLYTLARKGIEIERKPKQVTLKTTLLSYDYPRVRIDVVCSSGTYIRSIAHDLGLFLSCYGCIEELRRTASGGFSIEQCSLIDDLENNPDSPLLIQNL
jgi:tRNA pseudouridine55 synthase